MLSYSRIDMSSDNKEERYEELRGRIVEKYLNSNQLFRNSSLWKVWPSGITILKEYLDSAETIRHLTVRQDDVWIIGFPRSGTTWTQEIAWLLVNNLDYETAKKIMVYRRSQLVEYGGLSKIIKSETMTSLEEMKSPRVLKTHMRTQLLPQQLWTVKPRIIYVAREAKDVVVSNYHHHRLLFGYTGTIHDFVEVFVAESVRYGSLWNHILEFWEMRDQPNILFITYEEMNKDLPGVVQRIAKFLNRSLDSKQLQELCEHVNFESMKENSATNIKEELAILPLPKVEGKIEPFIRKGRVGNWKNELTPEEAEMIDKWTEEKLRGSDYVLQ